MSKQDQGPVSEPTIRDVALRAGVSVGTVSRVMNGAPAVRQPMREAVERAVRELGYQPNPTARLLRANRSRAVGMVVNDLLHGMNVIAVRGAEEAAEARGYSLLVADARHDPGVERRLIESLLSRRVEGLLVSPVRSVSAVENVVSKTRVPMLVFGQLRSRPGVHTTIIEEREAASSAITSLLALGHRRFLLTGQDQRVTTNRVREISDLFEDTATTGLDVRSSVVPDSETGVDAVCRALRNPGPPTAIISLTLAALPYTLRAIREAGISVPRDVSVLSFGDSEWAEAHTPPINVITSDYMEHLRESTNHLIDVIEGAAEHELSPVGRSRYIERGSVGPAPVAG